MSRASYIISITAIIFLIFSASGFADSGIIRPQYKISVYGGWGGYNLGEIYNADSLFLPYLQGYLDDPESVDVLTVPVNRSNGIFFNANSPEFAGQFSLGVHLKGPWYVTGGFHYEKWQELQNHSRTNDWAGRTVVTRLGQSFFETTAIIPFIAIEYTDRFWKFNYQSSIGIANCHTKMNVRYRAFTDDEIDLGRYKYNSIGIILAGGLSYDMFGFTSINLQGGYRIFGGNRLEPDERNNDIDMDFDYSGAFFGVGMSYGFGTL